MHKYCINRLKRLSWLRQVLQNTLRKNETTQRCRAAQWKSVHRLHKLELRDGDALLNEVDHIVNIEVRHRVIIVIVIFVLVVVIEVTAGGVDGDSLVLVLLEEGLGLDVGRRVEDAVEGVPGEREEVVDVADPLGVVGTNSRAGEGDDNVALGSA